MKKKVIVIGAGLGGLGTAIRLARKGYNVSVYEANAYPGGKLTEIKIGKYRFDAGPSLFTLPELIRELTEISGENFDTIFPLKRLDISCEYFYEDGTNIHGYADKDRFAEEASEKTGVSLKAVKKALRSSDIMYDYLGELFMFKPLRSLKTWLSAKALRAYIRIPQFHLFDTMHQVNQKQTQNSKITQLFNRYATYNGSDPYQAPATLNIIRHLEFTKGAYFPLNGMHQITDTLFALAKKAGVKFFFNNPVDKILTASASVIGIETGGEQVMGDYVVTNSDMTATYRKLLPDIEAPEKLLSQEKSSSALIYYWGVKKQFPELDLHNILFSKDYKKEFDHLFQSKTIDDDPTVYINVTSKYNPSDAPKDGENWFVMINVPHDDDQDWDKLIANARKSIVEKINRVLKTNIEELIEVEDYLDPRRIQSRTSSWQGALYGNSSNNRYAAFLRHPNRSKRLQNLYFCGGSVHPGGGIPLALSSAKIVSSYFPELS